MGLYATTTSLQIIMIGTEFDSMTTNLCSKMITHAENEINKYLSKRYDISSFNSTSTAVPPLVTSLCETLTEGYMYHRNSRGGKEWRDRGEELIKQAIENLKMIADYKLDLIDSSGDVITDSSNGTFQILSTTSEYSNTFNEDDELRWAVDPNKIDDIDLERD